MSKFTKGEWMLDNSPDEYNGNIFTYEPDGSYIGIARIKGLDYIDFKTEAQANARLIAAAPEMYELLKVWTQVGAEPMLRNARKRAEELLARIDKDNEEAEE